MLHTHTHFKKSQLWDFLGFCLFTPRSLNTNVLHGLNSVSLCVHTIFVARFVDQTRVVCQWCIDLYNFSRQRRIELTGCLYTFQGSKLICHNKFIYTTFNGHQYYIVIWKVAPTFYLSNLLSYLTICLQWASITGCQSRFVNGILHQKMYHCNDTDSRKKSSTPWKEIWKPHTFLSQLCPHLWQSTVNYISQSLLLRDKKTTLTLLCVCARFQRDLWNSTYVCFQPRAT